MQGDDQHDSNCFDFRNLTKIRDIERVVNPEIDSPGLLEGIRVGILDEFNIEDGARLAVIIVAVGYCRHVQQQLGLIPCRQLHE